MKRGVYVSLHSVLGIREFMSHYLGVEYDDNQRLTHYEMRNYLLCKGYPVPMSVNYSKVRIEDIIDGRYLVVAEETKNLNKKGKLIIYENPKRLDIPRVMESLKHNSDKDSLRNARNKNFIPQGFYENSMGEIIDIDFEENTEEILEELEPSVVDFNLEKENRHKTLVKTNGRHVKERRRHYGKY